MKKLLNLVTILLLLTLNAQTKIQDIKISDNLILSQHENVDSNKILRWKLTLKNNKLKKNIVLQSTKINFATGKNLYFPLPKNKNYLDIPNLINGFKVEDNLYVFLYIERSLWLYQYNFKSNNFTFTRKELFKLQAGSIENYGFYTIQVIESNQIENKRFFNISVSRKVSGQKILLVAFNIINNRLTKIEYSDEFIEIPDENETFQTLNLDTNKEKIITELKRALLLNRNIKKNDIIEYLGYVDDLEAHHTNKIYKIRDSGNTFFYFKKNNFIKIAKYSNDEFEWHLGTYTEEEIKEKIPKID